MHIFEGYIIHKKKNLTEKQGESKSVKKKYKQNKHGIKFIFLPNPSLNLVHNF